MKKLRKGMKGAISLFLVLLLLPFTEIATILISGQRYNASIALLDEVMDSSAISTLGNYDGYVRERFGLFSIQQKKAVSDTYDSFFDYNKDGVLHNSFTDNLNVTASGDLALSDIDVLYAQIRDYEKLNVPFHFVHNGLDINELIKNFEKSLKSFSGVVDIANAGIDVCDGALEFYESYEKLKTLSKRIGELKDNYTSTYNDFSGAITNLYNKRAELQKVIDDLDDLEDERADLQEQLDELNEKLEKATSQSEINQLKDEIKELEEDIEEKDDEIEDLKTKNEKKLEELEALTKTFDLNKGKFANAHTELIPKMESYRDEMKKAIDNLKKIIDSAGQTLTAIGTTVSLAQKQEAVNKNNAIEKQLKPYKDGTKEPDDNYYSLLSEKAKNDNIIGHYDIVNGMNSGVNGSIQELTKLENGAQSAFDDAAIQAVIDKLTENKPIIQALTADSVKDKRDGSDYFVSITVVLTPEQLDTLKDLLDSIVEEVSISLSDIWEAIKAFLEAIFKVKLVYDPALCSKIDTNYFAQEYGLTIDSPATNALATLIDAISNLVAGITKTLANLVPGNFHPKKAWEGLKQAWKGLKGTFVGIYELIKNLITSIVDIANDPTKIMLPYYLIQSLPCRTDYKTGSSITGGKFSKIEYANYGDSGVNGLPVIESVASLFNLAFGDKAADDKMFCGAELEYLIVGSNSEIHNQATVFGMLYVFRLLLDIRAWSKAVELNSIATGPQYGIVFAIYLLLEPFLDTMLLVNGENVSLWKEYPYLSIRGMGEFIPKIVKIAAKDDTSSAELKAKIKKIFEKFGTITETDTGSSQESGRAKYGKGLLKLSYKEYLLLLTLFFSNYDAELKLYQNLIQMETLAYNTRWHKGPFDIRKAYTQVTCKATGSAKPIFAAIFSDTIFKFERTQCRGY